MNFLSELPLLFKLMKYVEDISKVFVSLETGHLPDVAPLAKDLFVFVPQGLKAPNGQATEQEFVDAIFAIFKLFAK